MNEPLISPGMSRDLAALELADLWFEDRHGAEALALWSGGPDAELVELQLSAVRAGGLDDELWGRFEWELKCRIALVEEARSAIRARQRDAERGQA